MRVSVMVFASYGLVLRFAQEYFFSVPEKKDVSSDHVRAWNAGRVFLVGGRHRTADVIN